MVGQMKGLTALALSAALSAVAGVAPSPAAACPAVVAHRGDQEAAPENTLAAFEDAFDNGAPTIEFDVRFTRTDVPVVIHDATVDRTTNGRGRVAGMTFTALRRLRAGDQQIPTLYEALALIRERGGRAMVELKVRPSARQLERFLARIRRLRLERRVAVTSFDRRTLERVRAANPRVGIVAASGRNRFSPAQVRRHSTLYAAHKSVLDTDYVDSLHTAGIRVYAWTANSSTEWSALDVAGVDAVLTDFAGAYLWWVADTC